MLLPGISLFCGPLVLGEHFFSRPSVRSLAGICLLFSSAYNSRFVVGGIRTPVCAARSFVPDHAVLSSLGHVSAWSAVASRISGFRVPLRLCCALAVQVTCCFVHSRAVVTSAARLGLLLWSIADGGVVDLFAALDFARLVPRSGQFPLGFWASLGSSLAWSLHDVSPVLPVLGPSYAVGVGFLPIGFSSAGAL